jgi:hypothetical protein
MQDWHVAALREIDWIDWRTHVIQEAHKLHDDIETAIFDDSPIHPAGKRAVWGWLCELRDAACCGNLAEVRRLADMCREQIAEELANYEESLESAWQVSGPPSRRR